MHVKQLLQLVFHLYEAELLSCYLLASNFKYTHMTPFDEFVFSLLFRFRKYWRGTL